MVFNSVQNYQVKIDEKMRVIMIFLTSFFVIACLFSVNTSHSIVLDSGSGNTSTFELDQLTPKASHNNTIRDYSNSLPDLFEKVEKSVVQIT